MKDERFVYGARCAWFGSIAEIGKTATSLPCCPHCGSVLFELPSEKAWWDAVDAYDVVEPGYRKFVEWTRGQHFNSYEEAKSAYEKRVTT